MANSDSSEHPKRKGPRLGPSHHKECRTVQSPCSLDAPPCSPRHLLGTLLFPEGHRRLSPAVRAVSPPVPHVAALTQCGRTSQDRPGTGCPSSCLVSGKACYTRSLEPDTGWGLLRACCPFCILTSLRSAPSSRPRCWPGPGLPSPPHQAPRPRHACQHQPPEGTSKREI